MKTRTSIQTKTEMLSNNRGAVSMIYSIASLLLVTFVGSALMTNSRHETVASGDFGDIASAQICAESGVQCVAADVADKPADVLAALNKYIDSTYSGSDKGWLVGGENSWQFLSERQKFCAKIVGFDRTSLSMQVQVTGVTVGAGRKVINATFALTGVEFPVTATGASATHALYLGRSIAQINVHERMNVNGDTYIGSAAFFDNNTSGSTFDGEFRTVADTSKTLRMQGDFCFKGPTYIGTKSTWDVDGTVSFEDVVAFAAGIDCGGAKMNFSMKDNMYLRGAVTRGWTADFQLTNNYLIHNGKVNLSDVSGNSGDFSNYTPLNDHGSTDLLEALGMTSSEPSEVVIDTAVIKSIPASKKLVLSGTNNQWSASTLNAKFNTAYSAGTLWNGYLVVEIPSGVTLNLDDQDKPRGSFSGKVIFVDYGKVFVGSTGNGFYNSANSAITVMYVAKGGSTENLGGWDGDFRGYFYCEKGGRLCLGGSTTSTMIKGQIRGGINVADGASSFDWYPLVHNNPQIDFDSEVMDDISETGILTASGSSATLTQSTTLTLIATSMEATVIATRY